MTPTSGHLDRPPATAEHSTAETLGWENLANASSDTIDGSRIAITLGGTRLLTIDLGTRQILCRPDGEHATVLAMISRPTGPADDPATRAGIVASPAAGIDASNAAAVLERESGSWPVLSRADVESATGRWLTAAQIRRLSRQLRDPGVRTAIAVLVAGCDRDNELLGPPVTERDSVPDLVARFRAVADERIRVYFSYTGSLPAADRAVLPYEATRDRIHVELRRRGYNALAEALTLEAVRLGLLRDWEARHPGETPPSHFHSRAVDATQAVDCLAASGTAAGTASAD